MYLRLFMINVYHLVLISILFYKKHTFTNAVVYHLMRAVQT